MLSLRIALRYLFSRKSHSAVNIISMISMAGIAVAAMAMICVLSVFNGFTGLAVMRLSAVDPQIKVSLPYSAVISNGDSLALAVKRVEGVAHVRKSLEQRALAVSDGDQMPVRVKGVDDDYGDVSAIGTLVIDGEMIDTPSAAGDYALLSVGVAVRTGARPSVERPFILTAPRRLGRINPAFPMAAFRSDTLLVSGVYQTNQGEYDEDLVYIPLRSARKIFDYTTEITSLDVAVKPGFDPEDVVRSISRQIGGGYVVADRMQQQESSFRMISIEKWITFLMLVFVLVMASFNILSTMSMLIIEKEGNMRILSSFGAPLSMIRRIFLYEGVLIAVIGGCIGVTVGLVLCLLQQHCGIIGLGGDHDHLSIDYYPCEPQMFDVLVTLCVVLVVGFISGFISSRSVKVEGN